MLGGWFRFHLDGGLELISTVEFLAARIRRFVLKEGSIGSGGVGEASRRVSDVVPEVDGVGVGGLRPGRWSRGWEVILSPAIFLSDG